MEKNKLLISGRISEREARVLNIEFQNPDFDIVKYSAQGAAISGIHDIVHLIFDDLSPLSFARDYVIGKVLDITYSTIKKVAVRLRAKNKVVSSLSILHEYQKQDGSLVFVKFTAKEEKFDKLIKEVYEGLNFEFFEGIQAGKNVTVTLDNQDKLVIQVI
jgi:hypothetical protein